jgi:hypothetical protein
MLMASQEINYTGCPLICPGRSGSTFVVRLVKENLGINFEEWFSPLSYNSSFAAKNTSSKIEYLEYVYSIIRGKQPDFGIKITNDVCASVFWEDEIIENKDFLESLQSQQRAIVLTRINPLSAIISLLYSESTGIWHSDVPLNNIYQSTYPDALSKEHILSRACEYLDCEIRLLSLSSKHISDFQLFFFEDLLSDKEIFSRAILDYIAPGHLAKFELIIPTIKRIEKNEITYNKLRLILMNLAQTSPTLKELFYYRSKLIRDQRIFEKHHTFSKSQI